MRRTDAALVNQVDPGGFGVLVDRFLGREWTLALAVPAIIEYEHGISEVAQRSNIAHAGAHISVVAVQVEHHFRIPGGCSHPPAVQRRSGMAGQPYRKPDVADVEREIGGLRVKGSVRLENEIAYTALTAP